MGAQAALVSRGTTAPLSPTTICLPTVCRQAMQTISSPRSQQVRTPGSSVRLPAPPALRAAAGGVTGAQQEAPVSRALVKEGWG